MVLLFSIFILMKKFVVSTFVRLLIVPCEADCWQLFRTYKRVTQEKFHRGYKSRHKNYTQADFKHWYFFQNPWFWCLNGAKKRSKNTKKPFCYLHDIAKKFHFLFLNKTCSQSFWTWAKKFKFVEITKPDVHKGYVVVCKLWSVMWNNNRVTKLLPQFLMPLYSLTDLRNGTYYATNI